jgi:nitronate monooxygenase
MCTAESPIAEQVKQQIVANDERDTELIFRTFRNTARVAKNVISSQVVEIERGGGGFADVQELVSGARGRVVFELGDTDHGVWSAGQVQGLIHDVPSCAELVERMVTEAHALIDDRLAGISGAAVV